MKNNIRALRNELAEAEAELNDIYTMSEERACDLYNVDFKQEAILLMEEHIDGLIAKIDTLLDMLKPVGNTDPAFRSIADYNRMRL